MIKSAVLEENKKVVVKHIKQPDLLPDECEVKITNAGLCSSDIARGFSNGAYFYPLIMGHEIAGEITQTGGETRIKTSQKSDIVKISHEKLPQPLKAEISDIAEPLEGSLVKINGEITEIKGSYMYVDDGTEEVKTYFKKKQIYKNY